MTDKEKLIKLIALETSSISTLKNNLDESLDKEDTISGKKKILSGALILAYEIQDELNRNENNRSIADKFNSFSVDLIAVEDYIDQIEIRIQHYKRIQQLDTNDNKGVDINETDKLEEMELTSKMESFEYLNQLGFFDSKEFKGILLRKDKEYILSKILKIHIRTARGLLSNERSFVLDGEGKEKVRNKLREIKRS